MDLNSNEPSVVLVQPVTHSGGDILFVEVDPIPDTYLEWSIFNTICCIFTGAIVLFCSIPAMIFSCKTRELIENRRFELARQASKYSKALNIIASLIIIQCLIVSIVLASLWHRSYLFK
jgi:hypothetical protein